jgi:CubicO group peptidase (beta-lactamase class C family)
MDGSRALRWTPDGFGLGFQITVGDHEGWRSSGSLAWSGLLHTHFWVDPADGVAVVLMTQVLPFYDEGVMRLVANFERVLYGTLD